MIKKIIVVIGLSIGYFTLSNGAEIIPVANISFLGGQYFLKGDQGTFGGNVSLFFTPVINFTAQTALLPIFSFTYRGTKDVQELVGGGTLTQEYFNWSPFTLKLVHKFNNTIKGKIRIGYKEDYLKETKDEDWTKGLFDYKKFITGIEVEKILNSWNIRGGYDYYTTRYTNYSSLISKSLTTLDTTTYTEISKNAGENVLDYNTSDIFVEALRKFSDKITGSIYYDFAYKEFIDQSIVNSTGQFTTDKRRDYIHMLRANISFILTPKIRLSVYDSILSYTSTQNSYDGNNTKYIPNYYSFLQNDIIPILSIKLGNKEPGTSLDISWGYGYRIYQDRLTQDKDGNYLSEKTHQNTNTIGLSLEHPLSSIKGLSVKFSLNHRTTSSNMKHEENYKYNYYVFNYFVGFNWMY